MCERDGGCHPGVKRACMPFVERKIGQRAGEPLLLPMDVHPEPIEEKLTAWGDAAC